MNEKRHWLVKARGVGLNQLVGSAPNGTGADHWTWQDREYLELRGLDGSNVSLPPCIVKQAVFYGSRRAASCVMGQPDIISVEECQDESKF